MWIFLTTPALAGAITAGHVESLAVDGLPEVGSAWVTLARPWDGAAPSTRARAALAWTETHLCLAAELEDRDLVGRLTAHDSRTWHDDVVEVFLDRDASDPAYFELHVTPRGTVLDLELPLPQGGDWAAKAAARPFHVQAAVVLDGTLSPGDADRGWQAELCLPWSDLGGPPRPGEQWTVLIARYDRSHDGTWELSSTGSLTEPDFHRLQEYDRLVFAR